MENNSTSPLSPVWPTRWPKEAFRLGPSALWLLVVCGAIVAGTIAAAIVIRTVYGANGDPRGVIEQMLAMGIVYIFMVPFAWWFLPTAARVSLKNLGFVRPGIATLGIALGGAIAAVIATQFVGSVVEKLTHAPHAQSIAIAFTHLHQPGAIALFFFFAAIVGPIAEETIFRLFVFNFGLRYGGFWLGAILSAVLFGSAHLDIYNAPALAAIGLIFCAVYYFSKNAFASMIAHGLLNAIALVVLLIDPSAVNA
ncbi:MAG TPA: type II CAAX endopeptidase family protein [Verrucomicrobiae bacterium]|nr:type II CAAX endopeptidase family protein [Verrucomicrobiae bacterium]